MKMGRRLGMAARVVPTLAAMAVALPLSAFAQTQAPAAPEASAASEASAAPGAAAMGAMPDAAAVPPVAEGGMVAIPPANLPHDLSPLTMFMQADVVVKAVMLGLILASIITWTVWLAKTLELSAAKRRARTLVGLLEDAHTLPEAADRAGEAREAALVAAVLHEVRLSPEMPKDGIKERAASRLGRIEARLGRTIARGTGVLATIGATAPFVGLFGTVWGIMNAFIGISKAQTTNLAVVAPGIAEALLATAIGLVVAIPAVVIYNVFSRSIAGYRLTVADASAATWRLASRDLDRRSATPLRRAAE